MVSFTSKFDKDDKFLQSAARLQYLVAESERHDDKDDQTFKDDVFVKMNIVSARQDVIMMVALLSSLNRQAKATNYILQGILLGIFILIFRLFK